MMKPVDSLLWPIVARMHRYVIAMLATWLAVLPTIFIAMSMPALVGAITIAVGLTVIVVVMWALLDSRARFVAWRKWAWR